MGKKFAEDFGTSFEKNGRRFVRACGFLDVEIDKFSVHFFVVNFHGAEARMPRDRQGQ